MNPVKTFFNIVEIRTKVVSISTFVLASLGAALSLKENSEPYPWVNWWLMLASVLAVDMGTTGFNTFFDFLHGVDRLENNFEQAKVLVHKGVSPAQALFSSLALFFVAVVLGLIIAFRTNLIIAAIGAAGMAVGFFYSAGRRPISHTPLGEFFSGGFLGSVLFCVSWYVLAGSFSVKAFLYSIPVSLMISGILTTNNNCDLENDREAGRKTISILIGRTRGEILLYLEYAAAAAFVLFMQFGLKIYPAGKVYISIPILVLVGILFVRMHKNGFSPETKGSSMQSILMIFLIGSLFMIYPLIFRLLN